MVYCSNINGLFIPLSQIHYISEWRLFIDSSKVSLKAVLLHSGNSRPSIPVAYFVTIKESYVSMQKLFSAIKYHEFKWEIVDI